MPSRGLEPATMAHWPRGYSAEYEDASSIAATTAVFVMVTKNEKARVYEISGHVKNLQ